MVSATSPMAPGRLGLSRSWRLGTGGWGQVDLLLTKPDSDGTITVRLAEFRTGAVGSGSARNGDPPFRFQFQPRGGYRSVETRSVIRP